MTSDPSVVAVCDGYGVPCAPVAFPFKEDLAFVFCDHALSVDAPDRAPTVVDSDLRRVNWDDLLVGRPVAAATLDAIEAAVRQGVEAYLDRVAPD